MQGFPCIFPILWKTASSSLISSHNEMYADFLCPLKPREEILALPAGMLIPIKSPWRYPLRVSWEIYKGNMHNYIKMNYTLSKKACLDHKHGTKAD